MIYQQVFTLTANKPQTFGTINMSATRNHYLQINDSSTITLKATLDIKTPFTDLETITGPGIFSITISPQQFELLSDANTKVVLSGN